MYALKNTHLFYIGAFVVVSTWSKLMLRAVFVMSIVLIPVSCKKDKQNFNPIYSDKPINNKARTIYHFAVHPLHNPVLLMEIYRPLTDYLTERADGIQFNLETSTNYSDFEIKYEKRLPEFILPNPWQTLQAIKNGYRVIAMAGDASDFKGIVLVRKDSKIINPVDLKGKTVSYPSATALAACIMPQFYFYKNGIDVNKDIYNQYVGSQESSILNVYFKMSDAGATWPTAWRVFKKKYPVEAGSLKIIWETDPLINNSVMARNDIPEAIVDSVQKYLLEIAFRHDGKIILDKIEIVRFIKASNNDYDIVKIYTDNFEKYVRKIDFQ